MKLRTALFVIIAALTGSCSESGEAMRSFRDSSAPRVSVSTRVQGEVASVSDFVVLDDKLYVLDWRNRRVFQLARSPGTWSSVRHFGRDGQGPGELKAPVALAFNDSTHLLEILERSGEVEVFDTAGSYVRSERVELPCPSARIELAIYRGQHFVGERCLGVYSGSLADDSLFMVLASVHPNRHPDLLLHQATSTRDGSWGSIFIAGWPFSIGDGTVLFGGGVSNCIYHASLIRLLDAQSICDRDAVRYSAPQPKGFRNPSKQRAAEWPRPLPYFAGSLFVDSKPVLARLVSADSIGFESALQRGHIQLVAPLNSFTGCKQTKCLWFAEESGALELVDLARR